MGVQFSPLERVNRVRGDPESSHFLRPIATVEGFS